MEKYLLAMLFILFPIRKYVQIFVLFFIYTQQSA